MYGERTMVHIFTKSHLVVIRISLNLLQDQRLNFHQCVNKTMLKYI